MIDTIKNTINKFPLGYIFTTNDFPISEKNPKGVNKVLNDLTAEGYLSKLSKGRFYKPERGKFGDLKPDTYQTVKDLLIKDGKLIGYITGYYVFNELLLTTQVPVILQIAMRKEKKALERGIYRIHFVKQENTITKETVPLLRLLDCLRFFKTIPDTMPDKACQRMLQLLKELDEQQVAKIKKLAAKYNPQAIAMLGAMLEILNPQEDTSALFKKLNPLTHYKLSISETVLPTQKKWNIR
jgi:predicted transcriptional regulator of viral defense system